MKKVILVFAILLSGCLSSQQKNEIMQSFVGKHYSEAIPRWGPPTQVINNTDGGQIVSWKRIASYTSPGNADTTYIGSSAFTTYNPGSTFTIPHSKTFWTDPNGIVIRWAWQ